MFGRYLILFMTVGSGLLENFGSGLDAGTGSLIFESSGIQIEESSSEPVGFLSHL